MYNIWRNANHDVRLVEQNLPTFEEAQDRATYLTLTKYKEHIAILQGGKAEPVMQERARWTRINELMSDDFDDAGCDWIVIGDQTCIADIDWKASDNPEVARLIRESHIYNWGQERAKEFIYADEAEYYRRNPRLAKQEA